MASNAGLDRSLGPVATNTPPSHDQALTRPDQSLDRLGKWSAGDHDPRRGSNRRHARWHCLPSYSVAAAHPWAGRNQGPPFGQSMGDHQGRQTASTGSWPMMTTAAWQARHDGKAAAQPASRRRGGLSTRAMTRSLLDWMPPWPQARLGACKEAQKADAEELCARCVVEGACRLDGAG